MKPTYDRLRRIGVSGYGNPAYYVRSMHCDDVNSTAVFTDYFCFVLSRFGAYKFHIDSPFGVIHPGFKI